eukprot:12999-Prorocentrum_minimum.AAC.1
MPFTSPIKSNVRSVRPTRKETKSTEPSSLPAPPLDDFNSPCSDCASAIGRRISCVRVYIGAVMSTEVAKVRASDVAGNRREGVDTETWRHGKEDVAGDEMNDTTRVEAGPSARAAQALRAKSATAVRRADARAEDTMAEAAWAEDLDTCAFACA